MTPSVLLYHGKIGVGYCDLTVQELKVISESVSVCQVRRRRHTRQLQEIHELVAKPVYLQCNLPLQN